MDDILQEIRSLKESLDPVLTKKYNLEQTERIILRLSSFTDCMECDASLKEFGRHIQQIGQHSKISLNKDYFEFIKKVTDHLNKSHHLVTEGYYTSMYMAIGVAIGLPVGVAFASALRQMAFMGIGLPIGIGLGVAIGSSKDAQAKKDGSVI